VGLAPYFSSQLSTFNFQLSTFDLFYSSPFFSILSGHSYTTAAHQPFCNQFVTHSFHRDGGCTPSPDFFQPTTDCPRATVFGSSDERGVAMNRESVSMQREVPMAIGIQGTAPLLQVFDMPTSIKFYRDVLGFEVVTTSTPRSEHFDWALLRLNGVELMLNTAYEEDARPPAPDPARLAVHEDTCLYFGCPDVDAAYAYLRTRGVAAKEPKIAPYGMKQLYVSDPDGYNLCFQWPAK